MSYTPVLKDEIGRKPGSWKESEFRQASLNSELSQRTLSACYAVLVGGASNSDAAKEYKVPSPSISRGITGLLARLEKEISVDDLRELKGIMKAGAVDAARKIAGEGLVIEDAKAGYSYTGPIIAKFENFSVQKFGPGGIVHDDSSLNQVLVKGEKFMIEYPANGGLAKVSLMGEIEVERRGNARQNTSIER